MVCSVVICTFLVDFNFSLSGFVLPRHISTDRSRSALALIGRLWRTREAAYRSPARKGQTSRSVSASARLLSHSSRPELRLSPLSGAAAAFLKFPNPQTLNKSPPVRAIASRNPRLNPAVFFRGGREAVARWMGRRPALSVP